MNSVESFDEQLARKLQEEYDREVAAQLQNQDEENVNKETIFHNGIDSKKKRNLIPACTNPGFPDISPVDPSLECSDPNPDIRVLFLQFNTQFFWGRLSGIEVKWSPRMTLCAGLCVYEGHGGLCSVRLSQPLLKLRPRKDLVETLLHEMIHAYLFVTDNDRDHDGHGPQFKGHMHRINKATGANISIYHAFHNEVESYQQHWWRCDGPCQNRRPYFGYVKRAMNRAPSSRDFWWAEHQATCGGTYTKIKEPEGYGQKKTGKKEQEIKSKSKDIRAFGGKGHFLGSTVSKASSKPKSNNSSTIGSSNNPATIFNINNSNKNSRGSNISSSSSSSVIVNGILQRKTGNTSSSLFSEIQSTKVLSSVNSISTASGHEKHSPHMNGSPSKIPTTSKHRSGIGDAADDDDAELWMTDIDNIESTPLSSFLKNKDSKDKTGSKSKYQTSSNTDGKKTFKDSRRKSRFSFKSKGGGNKPSVCKGGVFYKEKTERKKNKYLLDELDSNDNLWEVPCRSSVVKKEIKSELNVSPLKIQLKEECRIKDEKIMSKFHSSNFKSEKLSPSHKGNSGYFSPSNQSNQRTNRNTSRIPEGGRIETKSEKHIEEDPNDFLLKNRNNSGVEDDKKLSDTDFILDIVDLSDFDDDEFDFVSSKRNVFNKKIPKDKKAEKASSSQSQRSIGSFFTSLGNKRCKSNVKSNMFESNLSSNRSKCKDDHDISDELPDISDNEGNDIARKRNKLLPDQLTDDTVDISEDDNDEPCFLSSKSVKKESKSKSSSVGGIRNYFSNTANASSSKGSKYGSNQSTSDKHKKKLISENITISINSDSNGSEDFTKECVSNKKRSSNEAFGYDNTETSEDDDSKEKRNFLFSKRTKQSADTESPIGSSIGATGEEGNGGSEGLGNNQSGKVTCPICNIFVSQADINSHLDSCLE